MASPRARGSLNISSGWNNADSSFRLHTAKVMGTALMRGASAATIESIRISPDTWRDYNRWQLVLDDRGATWIALVRLKNGRITNSLASRCAMA